MGRPQTIYVNQDDLLGEIASQIVTDVRSVDSQLAKREPYAYQSLHRARREALAPTQDLDRWAGMRLTAAERIRWQQAVVILLDDGLIDRIGRRVSVTAEGWAALGIPDPTEAPR